MHEHYGPAQPSGDQEDYHSQNHDGDYAANDHQTLSQHTLPLAQTCCLIP